MQPVKLTKSTSLPNKMSSLSVTDKSAASKSPAAGGGVSGGGISLPAKKSTCGISVNAAVAKKISLSPFEHEESLQLFLDGDTAQRLSTIDRLFTEASTKEFSAVDIAVVVGKLGVCSAEGTYVVAKVMSDVSESGLRENALAVLAKLLRRLGRVIEPFVMPLFPHLVSLHGDKATPVREFVATVCSEYATVICPFAFRTLFPTLLSALKEEDWKIKVGALEFIKQVAPRISFQISPLLTELIPCASECIIDSKKQVSTTGMEALLAACRAITNDDIRPLVPQLVSVIAKPDETPKTLDALLETTFVSNVDAPTLALIAPLLGKALRGRVTIVKRKAARVIDIMCRLVQEPADVAPFVPLLLPALEKCIDEIVDAEVIEVARAAKEVLLKAMGEGKVNAGSKAVKQTPGSSGLDTQEVNTRLREAIDSVIGNDASSVAAHVNSYIALTTANLVVYGTLPNPTAPENPADAWRAAVAMVPIDDWKSCVVPYMSSYRTENQPPSSVHGDLISPSGELSDDFENMAAMIFRHNALGSVPDAQADDDVDGGNVCNIDFSLAFGGKILLHNTKLRLGRNRRYAIMGKNGAGKTTLLTNVGTGNIEGMPPELKTLYVMHDDPSDDFGINIVDEAMTCKELEGTGVTREDLVAALKRISFTDEMMAGPRSGLSGGWLMKLILVKAMLSKADILLMDEPTNHLDTASVQWLVDFIIGNKEATCMIVSHDVAFLDKVVTDVIHYENKKLVYYHGNMTKFVEIHPEAKYYYELEGSTLSFKFPTPERLDGINSTTRSVMKMENVTFTYPGAAKPQLEDVSARICLGSRIAVVGTNGAGKSTLIKLLVQETQPDPGSGEVWKHQNLRLAYVAQHSFHHIEQHLDQSPVDYIKWRFHGGVDKEDLSRPTMKLTEEEQEERKGPKKTGDIEQIVGRRKVGRTIEYECTWFGQGFVEGTHREKAKKDENKYLTMETLIEMGFAKEIQQCDARIAAANAGLDLRPLVTAEIQGHLDDFNLDAEYGTHGSIRRLSGGQKVKLVLAAAMWNRPHVIFLDEPTNYLDREALGALAQAVKGFSGGVVVISHNAEFTDAICTERWLVDGGKCHTTGAVEETDLKVSASGKLRKNKSSGSLDSKGIGEAAGVNLNSTIVNKVLLNPKTMETLSKKEVRLLSRCAEVAGVSLEEYVSKLTCKSPEWKWL